MNSIIRLDAITPIIGPNRDEHSRFRQNRKFLALGVSLRQGHAVEPRSALGELIPEWRSIPACETVELREELTRDLH